MCIQSFLSIPTWISQVLQAELAAGAHMAPPVDGVAASDDVESEGDGLDDEGLGSLLKAVTLIDFIVWSGWRKFSSWCGPTLKKYGCLFDTKIDFGRVVGSSFIKQNGCWCLLFYISYICDFFQSRSGVTSMIFSKVDQGRWHNIVSEALPESSDRETSEFQALSVDGYMQLGDVELDEGSRSEKGGEEPEPSPGHASPDAETIPATPTELATPLDRAYDFPKLALASLEIYNDQDPEIPETPSPTHGQAPPEVAPAGSAEQPASFEKSVACWKTKFDLHS